MDFWKLIFRFVPAYKGRIFWYVIFNILTSIFCVFSFATVIPLIRVIFGEETETISFIEWQSIDSISTALDVSKNNVIYWLQDQVYSSSTDKALLMICLFLIITSALSNLCSYFAYYIRIPIRTGISRDLRKDVYAKITCMPINIINHERKGDYVSRMTSDVEEVDYGIGTTLDMLIKDPVQIIVYITTMFGISYILSLEALALLLLNGLVLWSIGRTMKSIAMKGQVQKGRILTSFEEVFGHLSVLRAFNLELFFNKQFGKVNEDARTIFNRINRRYSIAFPLTEFLIVVIIAIMLLIGGRYVKSGNSTLAASEFIYFLMVFYSVIPPMRDMIKATFGIRKAMASVERMNKILLVDTKQRINKDISIREEIVKVHNGETLIEIDNLHFSFNEEVVFNGINLNIKKGQKVAIIGDVGKGKSTLAYLLLKLYECPGNSTFIAGIDINDIGNETLRDVISYVPQDPTLFNGSMMDNITMWNDNHKKGRLDEVLALLSKSNIPTDWNINIGENGVLLSGGQKQSVAIARALLKEAEIYILDEPSSALDNSSIDNVMSFIDTVLKDKTVIMMTHDSRTIKYVDAVIKLK